MTPSERLRRIADILEMSDEELMGFQISCISEDGKETFYPIHFERKEMTIVFHCEFETISNVISFRFHEPSGRLYDERRSIPANGTMKLAYTIGVISDQDLSEMRRTGQI